MAAFPLVCVSRIETENAHDTVLVLDPHPVAPRLVQDTFDLKWIVNPHQDQTGAPPGSPETATRERNDLVAQRRLRATKRLKRYSRHYGGESTGNSD